MPNFVMSILPFLLVIFNQLNRTTRLRFAYIPFPVSKHAIGVNEYGAMRHSVYGF
jgi:hypothetical protein